VTSCWKKTGFVLALAAGLLAETAAAVVSSEAAAAPGAPAPAPFEWRPAPLYGADIRSLAVDPRDPNLVLAGTSAGQVYRSGDGGATWADAGAALPLPGWVVGTLAFDPNRPGRVWAALWGIFGGGFVVHSDDLGRTWQHPHPVREEEQVYTLAPVPGAPGRLFAATRRGVYRSEDDGASWLLVTAAYPEIVNVSSLWVDPLATQTVLAGTWRRAYRSDDGGTTWRGVFTGMVEDSEVFSLHSVPWNRGELWASTCGWVYQTLDLGGQWQRFKNGLDERRTPSFAVLVQGRLLAGTVAGLYSSDDRGLTWQRRTGPELAVMAVAQHPARPERVLLGTEGSGVWRSEDGGTTFRPAAPGMHNLRVMALAREGRRVLAAVNHAGPASGIYSSDDGGGTFTPDPAPVPTVLSLAVGDGRAWAATERGLYERTATGWRRVEHFGQERIEQVRIGDGRVVVRSARGLFEQHGTGFLPIPYKHGTPRGAALAGDVLYVTDDGGLYRLAGGENHTAPSPMRGALVESLGEQLFLSGRGGLWARVEPAGEWRAFWTQSSRLLPTGESRYPALVIAGEQALLLRAGAEPLNVDLAFPARDVASALVVDGKLLLGTSGHGLQVASLPVPD
jgi:photosystem II stability/assembly factor-like uncharacterized protein